MIRILIVVSLVSFAACTKPPAPPAAAEPAHAAPTARPGPHEDWCAEHAVPESQCTRCNPKLTPAFQATGDWCEEHALPKTQCTKCDPGLKVARPPKGS